MATYQPSPQDEGYSEAPLTAGNTVATKPTWLSSIPAADRLDIVMSIINHLPTSEVCEIVKRVRPRLYIDFFHYLPPEVCLKVLSYLDPASLFHTAMASKGWMRLALDRQLWERLYYSEGFRILQAEVVNFEASLSTDRTRNGSHLIDEHASKKRATPQRLLPSLRTDMDADMIDVGSSSQHSEPLFGTARFTGSAANCDALMFDQPNSFSSQKSPQECNPCQPCPLSEKITRKHNPIHTETLLKPSLSSLVLVDRGDGKKKINWQHLYSTRRRLEANWEAEKYVKFQLPHPDHPEEAHTECIYTIQYSGKYLVSGSRDHTLRIWDLDTKRLVRAPLRAHVGSVLCLQFDADPKEDLIVSGSSDATVVLWKFSTGQIIQRLRNAHKESVLNVRFDKRVLVTCSKDKTIKIFNRRAIGPGDTGFPVAPTKHITNFEHNFTPSAGLSIKPAYSMIGCLDGHGAAVNAVQICGNEVVSASGDRTIKVWNWPEQACTRTLTGHQKGIACVQYDGRRIVSGSSDNEVKVFDKHTGVEVASLRAHTNLVRTVQAGFGDLPHSVEQDREDARKIDLEYFKAVDSGEVEHVIKQKGRFLNAGSRKPKDITAFGALLPPGGGGGHFGRIVSGSYDETIIIWRRDKEGIWKAKHILRQEAAAIAANEPSNDRRGSPPSQPSQNTQNASNLAASALSVNAPLAPASAAVSTITISTGDSPTASFAPGTKEYYHQLIDQTLPQGPYALHQAIGKYPEMINYAYLQESIDVLSDNTREAMGFIVAAAISRRQITHPSIPPTPNTTPNQTVMHSVMHAAQAQLAFQAQTIPSGIVHPNSTTSILDQANQLVAPSPLPTQQLPPASMARVFKLQFDARRIICCSQTPVILGWDFANEDEQIIEASKFFAPIE